MSRLQEKGEDKGFVDAPHFVQDTATAECVGLGEFLSQEQLFGFVNFQSSHWYFTLITYVSLSRAQGIVRNIDPVNKLLYILTPVPLHTLDRVNLLEKGNLEIPASLLLQVGLVMHCFTNANFC